LPSGAGDTEISLLSITSTAGSPAGGRETVTREAMPYLSAGGKMFLSFCRCTLRTPRDCPAWLMVKRTVRMLATDEWGLSFSEQSFLPKRP
jgi:hypothetical protein